MMTRSKTRKNEEIIKANKRKGLDSKVLDVTWIMTKNPIKNFDDKSIYYDFSETNQIPKNVTALKIGTDTMMVTFKSLKNDSPIVIKESIDDIINMYETKIDRSNNKMLQKMIQTWHSYAIMFFNEQYYYYTFEKL